VKYNGNDRNAIVELFDYTGKMIQSEIIVNDELSINIIGLNKGIYYLRLVTSDNTLTKRFIKL
jgi:hypothetical protein